MFKYGKRVVQIEKWTGGGKSTLFSQVRAGHDFGHENMILGMILGMKMEKPCFHA